MSVKDSMSTHPNYKPVAQAVREWLAGSGLQCASTEEAVAIEETAISELLHLTDISAFGAASHNVAMYLEGKIDNTGKTVDYGQKGQLSRVRQKAFNSTEPVKDVNASISPNFFSIPPNFFNMVVGAHIPRYRLGMVGMHPQFAQHFIDVTKRAGLTLSADDAMGYAIEAGLRGATTLEEAMKFLDYRLGVLNPSKVEVPIAVLGDVNRIHEVVAQLIRVSGLVRMPWQLHNYAVEIYSMHSEPQNLTERQIHKDLFNIVSNEGVTPVRSDDPEFEALPVRVKEVAKLVYDQVQELGVAWSMGHIIGKAELLCNAFPTNDNLTLEFIKETVQYDISAMQTQVTRIGQKPDPFADMSPEHKAVAEEVRRVLAAQGESWTMGKIREFSRKLWDANAKNGWPTCEYIAEQVLVALEMGDTKQSITRNIGEAEVVVNSRYSGVDALNALISLENTALQEPVKAFEVDDHYRYTRNDVQFVIAREYGQSPEGNPLMGSWVIRNFFTGDYIDHDRHRTDLAERHAIKLES